MVFRFLAVDNLQFNEKIFENHLIRFRQCSRMSNDLRAQIHHKLIESGEKERLKDHLRMRLIECGWRDQLKVHAKDIVRERGLERVKLEDLVKEITSKGRTLVPDSVKRELLIKIKDFLAQQQNI